MSEKKKLNVKGLSKITKKVKSVKADGTVVTRPDRITSNLSMEVFNGCWVGFGYESDVKPSETLAQAKERVWSEVTETISERQESLVYEENK